jgi:hypothetical protein
MKLCEMPEAEVKTGLRVWNFHKTQQGTITRLWYDVEGLNVEVEWDNGSKSDQWHFQLEIEVV